MDADEDGTLADGPITVTPETGRTNDHVMICKYFAEP